MKDIEQTRKKIDEINNQLVELLEKRMFLSEDVVNYKIANQKPIYDKNREKEILNSVVSRTNPKIKNEMVGIFSSIMNMSKLYQYRLSDYKEIRTLLEKAMQKAPETEENACIIACQGINGAYSSIAAKKMYPNAILKFYDTWQEVFTALENGEAQYGVLPIENSTAGSVLEVYKLIMQHKLSIVSAIAYPINHSLLGIKGANENKIKAIYSHPQAIEQCYEYLKRKNVQCFEYLNTALAAKYISEKNDLESAAVASEECAKIYGLDILKSNIQTISGNTTRFVALSKKMEIGRNANKISIQFSLRHENGTLVNTLSYFNAMNLNLTKIESRPQDSNSFDYDFYLDFEGSVYDENVFNFICSLGKELDNFKFIGNYYEINS